MPIMFGQYSLDRRGQIDVEKAARDLELQVKGVNLPLDPSEGDIIAAEAKLRKGRLEESFRVAKDNLEMSQGCEGSTALRSARETIQRINQIQQDLNLCDEIEYSYGRGLVERARRYMMIMFKIKAPYPLSPQI